MEIVIRLVDGRLQIKSSIDDKIVLVGILEFAKQTMLVQAAAPAVQPAPSELVNQLTGVR